MGIFGNIMRVIVIILVAIFAILAFFLVLLFIFPSWHIFGYHYISSEGDLNKTYFLYDISHSDDSEENAPWVNSQVLRIETFDYSVVIRTVEDEAYSDQNVVFRVNGDYNGFARGAVENFKLTGTYFTRQTLSEGGKNVYYMQMKEPNGGVLLKNNTIITIVASKTVFMTKELQIVTNGGKVTIGQNETMNFSNLSINSHKGLVELKNMKCTNSLDITKAEGNVEATTNATLLCKTDIEINSRYGYINIPTFGKESDTTNKLDIRVKNAHTILGNVYGDLEFISEKGVFKAGKIYEYADFKYYETDCTTEEFEKGLQIDGTSGPFRCGTIKGTAELESTSGGINVSKALGMVYWKSTTGSLTLSEAHKNIVCQTTNGNININCATGKSFEIDITSRGGNINFAKASGVVKINENLDYSNVNIVGSFLNNMSTFENILKTNQGNITLTIPARYLLLSWATAGNASIDFIDHISTKKTTQQETNSQLEFINFLTLEAAESDPTLPKIKVLTTTGNIKIVTP